MPCDAGLVIRPATAADAPDVQALWNLAIRETLITFNAQEKTLPEVAQAITGLDAFFVAYDAGKLLGYASYGPFRSGIGYAHSREHSIMLAPKARGRGLGRRLMQHIEEHARTQGIHILVAGISSANSGAEPFHKALGFVTVGYMPEVGKKFGTWQDLVLMQKTL